MDMSYYHLIAAHQSLRNVEGRTETQGLQLADLRRELSELKGELRNMQLVNQAFLEVIADRIGLEQSGVEERLKELLEQDRVAQPCGQCQRPLPKSGRDCLYCGAAPSQPLS